MLTLITQFGGGNWNRLGTRIIPKLRSGANLSIHVDISSTIGADSAEIVERELQQALQELGLKEQMRISLDDR